MLPLLFLRGTNDNCARQHGAARRHRPAGPCRTDRAYRAHGVEHYGADRADRPRRGNRCDRPHRRNGRNGRDRAYRAHGCKRPERYRPYRPHRAGNGWENFI